MDDQGSGAGVEGSPAEEATETPAQEAAEESGNHVQPFIGSGIVLYRSQKEASKSRRKKKHKDY